MTLTAGTQLGPYRIEALLGAGGMGEVYRATDTRLDRTVAVKVLPQALAADPQFRERFDREAKTISQLNHPNICTLCDVGHQEGTAYLVMEYLQGETLAALDRRRRCVGAVAGDIDRAGLLPGQAGGGTRRSLPDRHAGGVQRLLFRYRCDSGNLTRRTPCGVRPGGASGPRRQHAVGP